MLNLSNIDKEQQRKMFLSEDEIKKQVQIFMAKIASDSAYEASFIKNTISRAGGLPERIFFIESAPRLMPLARNQILEQTQKGSSHYCCACWWANSLSMARGRMGRKWWSPSGGLYLCISLFPQLLPENRVLYSLSIGLAACQCLCSLGVKARIRWINDVLIGDKKVCGILSQTVSTPKTQEEYLLFGIGINVNVSSFPKELEAIATSVRLESGRKWSILKVGSNLLARAIFNFSMLHEWESRCLREGLTFRETENPVISQYRKFADLENKRVLYGRDLEQGKGICCVSRGITEKGFLILERHGEIFKVESGEIRFL